MASSSNDSGAPSAHTPGPWYVFTQMERLPYQHHDDEEVHEHRYILKTKGVTIAAVNTKCLLYQNDEADARLIAAAPELLEALRHLLAQYPEQCECAPGFKMDGAEFPPIVCGWCDARAAIAKATERSEAL